MSKTLSKTHLAAILPTRGSRFVVGERPTPEPGPNEVLLELKAVALNPADYLQRDTGMPPVPVYPAVIGCDGAGVIAKVGANVSPATGLKVGDRVLALVTSFFLNGNPDYGAFQTHVLAPIEVVVPLPESLSFEEAAKLPLAVSTALSAWTSVGISLDTRYQPEEKEAVLIWGGASSVGTLAIQSARTLGFTVYTTARPAHHAYLKTLGAYATFDYKSADVVDQIVGAVKQDGAHLRTAHCVVTGGLEPTLDVLRAVKTSADEKTVVASSALVPPDHTKLENTVVQFNIPPLASVEERNRHYYKCFHGWLEPGLRAGTIIASPPAQIESGGLEGLNAALDKLRGGVSLTKIVVPL